MGTSCRVEERQHWQMYGNPIENQPRFTISYHNHKMPLVALKTTFFDFMTSPQHCADGLLLHFVKLADVCTSSPGSPARAGYCTPEGRFSYAHSQPLGRIFVVAMRPHSQFRRFVSLLLAVLVLTTSVGLTVQRLTCRMSGRSTVALSVAGRADLRGCTGELAPATPAAKDNCCDFSKQVHKLTLPTHELASKILVPPPLLAVDVPALTWPRLAATAEPKGGGPRWFAADSSPPPLGGRGLLTFVCTLVV